MRKLLSSQTYTVHAKYCKMVKELTDYESDDSESSDEDQIIDHYYIDKYKNERNAHVFENRLNQDDYA